MAQLKGEERARYVARMFARISGRYDLLNSVMTAGRHHGWRRTAAQMAVGDLLGDSPSRDDDASSGRQRADGPALDVATGTGDFAHSLARLPGVKHVVGVDYVREMLVIAERKARQQRLSGRVEYVAGDAHALPFPDDHFICATVGFGVRNFVDIPVALKEMARVTRPGGRVVLLEIVRMERHGPMAKVFPLYFRYVTPILGAALARDREAYKYLPESVQEFLTSSQIVSMMKKCGLRNIAVRELALGAVSTIIGEKAVP